MSAFHIACVEGDIERLGKEQRLYNPTFVDESPTLVHELLTEKRVPFHDRGHGSKKHCKWMTGTPAELAVRAEHYNCANLVLSVPLFRWMKLAPWTTKFRNCTKMVFTRRGDVLKDLLAFLGSRQWVHLTKFCKASWECDVEVYHTLLAACILGQAKVVKAVLDKVSLDFFDDIDAQMQRKGMVSEEEPMFCRDLASTAAALGGDAATVELVLDAFQANISAYTLQEVWICLKNPLWFWAVPQWPACLKIVAGKSCFEGVKKLSCEFEVFCLFFIHLNNWFIERDNLTEKYKCAAKVLPPSQEVLDALKAALPKALSMIHHDCLAKLDVSTFFKKVIDDSRKSIGPGSCLADLTEEVVIRIFTHPTSVTVLMGRDAALTLADLTPDQQTCYLATVCQFMFLSPKPNLCETLMNGCALCHPLVNFISGVRKPQLSILSERNLWTLFPYFSQKEMWLTREIFRKPQASTALCATHRTEMRHGRYPLFGSMKKKAPHVLEVLDKVRHGVSLQQLCLMQILSDLQGEHSRLQTLDMPGGLRGYFLLEGFLAKLCSKQE